MLVLNNIGGVFRRRGSRKGWGRVELAAAELIEMYSGSEGKIGWKKRQMVLVFSEKKSASSHVTCEKNF